MVDHLDIRPEDDPGPPLRVFQPDAEIENTETAPLPLDNVSPKTAGEERVQGLRFGVRSAVAALAIFLAQLFLLSGVNELTNNIYSIYTMLWLASVWSGWSISIWLLIRQPISIVRAGLICSSFGWHCIMMMLGRDQPIERYMILLGYFGFLQVIACIVLKCPVFRLPGEPSGTVIGKRQFSILTIALITTGLAVVMFSAREYDQQSPGSESFFASTALTMPALLLAFVVSSLSSRSRLPVSVGLVLVLSTAMLSASLLVTVESSFQAPDPNPNFITSWDELWIVYAIVVSIIGLTVFCFGRLALDDAK